MDFDTIIVGGGPAGLASSLILGRNGLHVGVIEKSSYPIDKVCGEGLMPTGIRVLDELKVTPLIKNQSPLVGIRYISANGGVAQASFAEGEGLGIKRTELSHALRSKAKEYPNIEIFSQTRCEDISESPKGITLTVRTVSHGEKEDTMKIQTRLLIGADGLFSKVRRLGKFGTKKSDLFRFGMRRHFSRDSWTNAYVEVYTKGSIEAYVTPVGDKTLGVAFLFDIRHFTPGMDLTRSYLSFLDEFPLLKGYLTEGKPLDEPSMMGPLQQVVKQQTQNGILLLGDAAGYLDAITGEGLSLAFEQAMSLEKSIVPTLIQRRESTRLGVISADQLKTYQKEYNRICRNYRFITRLTLWVCASPRLFDALVRVLGKAPSAFRTLMSMNMGTRELLPGFISLLPMIVNVLRQYIRNKLFSETSQDPGQSVGLNRT